MANLRVALTAVSHFIITALPQHFSSSISQMQRASLHGDWPPRPPRETEHFIEEGSLECDLTHVCPQSIAVQMDISSIVTQR